MTIQVIQRAPSQPSSRTGQIDLRGGLPTPVRVDDERPGQGGRRGRVGRDDAEKTDASRLLADEWIAGLGTRPFKPTADQLASVWGGELARGETQEQRVRVAAGRYAALFTDHVVEDVTIDGGPGAYVRIWQCARQAFIRSMTSEPAGRSVGVDVFASVNESGAAV